MTSWVVATAGHVDHGKSTLVRALTGTDPDRLEEEKRRGLTIDLGFARMPVSGGTVELVDVPGHVRFLKNMLAGVGAVDACLFVVAATEGWKAQSEEHLRILDLLGVRRGLLVLTMASVVDPDQLELVRVTVEQRTASSFLEGAPIIACDAVDGAGLPDVHRALDLLTADLPARPDLRRPRLWIDRAFAIAGAGTVVTGTLTGGSIVTDDDLEVVTRTAVHPVRVRALQSFGTDRTSLRPGSRAAINLAGVHFRSVRRGDAVVRPGQWHRTNRFDASLQVLPAYRGHVRTGGAFVVHLGCGDHAARVRVLGTRQLGPGDAGLLRIDLPFALPLLPGDRFVLRDTGSGTTVGGGQLLDVDPVLPISRARPDRTVTRVIAERGWVPVDELERLTGERVEPVLGSWVVDPDELRTAGARIRAQVDAAGPLGLDLASLGSRDRLLVDADDSLAVVAGRARRAGDIAPLGHRLLQALDAARFRPPTPESMGVSRAEVRDLVRRGVVVEEGGLIFSRTAPEAAARIAAHLLSDQPEGFTVSELREALGTSRRFTMALIARLDRDGMTRRDGDRRVRGPRLGAGPAVAARGDRPTGAATS